MKHFHDEWIQEWCEHNGWTEPFSERYRYYWAFPPGAVMPEPIPQKELRIIKTEKGLTADEQRWLAIAGILSTLAVVLCYFLTCPMPIVFAFAFDAITFALLEVEGI